VGFMGFSFINNIYYDESDLKKMFSNMAPYLKIMKRFMPEVKLKDVIKYFSENFSKFIRYMKVNPEAEAVLKKLKKSGLKIGCITNSHKNITKLEIRKSDLSDLIDIIVTADDVKKPKPDPEMLLKACRKLGVKTSEIIFIGDTPTDLKTANSACCIFIGFRIRTMLNIKNLGDLIPLIKRKFSL
ncbi:MAG: HAD-IA family hydrolase, partial [candidate division WOR-3 bacterium]